MTITNEIFLTAIGLIASIIGWLIKDRFNSKKEAAEMALRNAKEHQQLAEKAAEENRNIQLNYKARFDNLTKVVYDKIEEVKVENHSSVEKLDKKLSSQLDKLREDLSNSFEKQNLDVTNQIDKAFSGLQKTLDLLISKVDQVDTAQRELVKEYLPGLQMSKNQADRKLRSSKTRVD
ncbi:MAG: hypothetical protein LCH52_08285 [Bacteroidetes bacterium]|nr:hypothetical protein [Bacteroidota bacterium]